MLNLLYYKFFAHAHLRLLTDVTNASRTMLMNLRTLNYDSEMLKFFDLVNKLLINLSIFNGR